MLKTVERNNSVTAAGMFMNSTDSYQIPIQHFIESGEYTVYYIDPRVMESARTVSDFEKVKSDKVD